MFDFLKRPKKDNGPSYQSLLADARTRVGTDENKLAPLLANYDDVALATVLKKKASKKPDYKKTEAEKELAKAQHVARHLVALKKAETALQQGNIEPALEIATAGNFGSYKLLAQETANIHVANANAKIAATFFKDDAQESSGRGYFFARSCAKEAILGYSALNMPAECQNTLSMAKERFQEHGEDYLTFGLNEFRTGAPDKIALGVATIAIIQESQGVLGFDDHAAIVKYHPDDKQKTASIKNIVANKNGRYDAKQSFDVLLPVVKTEGGQPKPSQYAAMQGLKNELHHMHSPYMNVKNAQADLYYGVVLEELEQGSAHVLDTVFGDLDESLTFMVAYCNYADEPTQPMRNMKLADLIPADAQGEGAATARNHLARQMVKQTAQSYLSSSAENIFETDAKRRGDMVRQATRLVRQVLMDETVPEASSQRVQSQNMLKEIILLEDTKTVMDQKNLLTVMQDNSSVYGQAYKDQAQEHVQQRQTYIGHGRSTLDILETNGNAASLASAHAIRQNIARNQAAGPPATQPALINA